MPSKAPIPRRKLAHAVLEATTSFAQNLYRLRKARGLNQGQLAHAIGLTGANAGAMISRLEAGLQHPRWSTVMSLAEALGVSLSALTKRK
jgi:transcriptional regulator with XRE-family HTH domain